MTYRARKLATVLRKAARDYPVVTLTGPRQSGKTTLCQAVFPSKAYVTLEPMDQREYARTDPRGFLDEYARGAIIDEIQNVPELTSYLQEAVDRDPRPGRFILTGSQHFGLTQAVSQSLAGRTAMINLLPLSLEEMPAFAVATDDLFSVLLGGGYPRIHDRALEPQRWLNDYLATYIERDVRQLSNIGDLEAFSRFVRLCAGRTGQEINLSALGGDAGVSHNTARAWLSVLESGFIVFRAAAWHRNLRKQMVKAPKLHFVDSGLVCYLLGIRQPDELRHHPLRGAIFESWVAAEIYKYRSHRGQFMNIRHFRESRGIEIDIVVEDGESLIACEVKSASTIDPSFFRNLDRFGELMRQAGAGPKMTNRLVYGGDRGQRRQNVSVISWKEIHKQPWGA